MTKFIKILFIIIAFTSIVELDAQDPNIKKTRSYTSWDKAVITDSEIKTILPFMFPIKEGLIDTPGCMTSKILVADVLQKGSMAEFKYTDSAYCMSADFVSSINLLPCKANDLIFPKAWDFNKNYKFDIRVITNYNNIPKTQVTGISDCICLGGPKFHPAKIFKYDSNKNPILDENGMPIFEEIVPEFEAIVHYRIIAINEHTLQMFLLKDNQFLVWEFDSEKNKNDRWKFLYAFKVYETEPYRLCQLDKTLYIVMKDAGIYKLDVESAIENKPDDPKEVIVELPNIDKYKVLKWEGFDQDHIKENSVFADKISDLSYTSFIVDKDKNTAYFQAGDYFFEITDLDHCVKMPPIWEGLETFEDKEADRLRTVLEAIENLHKKPIKSPDYRTVMGLPEEVIAKPNTNKNINNPLMNNNGNNDDNRSNTNPNGDSPYNNGSYSPFDSSNGELNSGDNSDNSMGTDENGKSRNGKTGSNGNSEIIDDSSIFTYIAIPAGIILFFTILLFLFARKHRSQ